MDQADRSGPPSFEAPGPTPAQPPAPVPPQPSAPAEPLVVTESATTAPQQRPRPRSRGLRVFRGIAWTLFGAGVAALAAFSGYLWLTHEQWVDQNEELRTEALELGEQLATARAESEANAADLAQTQAQLDEAKNTISTLADEDANASDDFRFATDVIEQMRTCAEERDELIGYLKQAERYTASSLRQAESSIDEYCQEVEDAWETYLEEEG